MVKRSSGRQRTRCDAVAHRRARAAALRISRVARPRVTLGYPRRPCAHREPRRESAKLRPHPAVALARAKRIRSPANRHRGADPRGSASNVCVSEGSLPGLRQVRRRGRGLGPWRLRPRRYHDYLPPSTSTGPRPPRLFSDGFRPGSCFGKGWAARGPKGGRLKVGSPSAVSDLWDLRHGGFGTRGTPLQVFTHGPLGFAKRLDRYGKRRTHSIRH